MIYFSGRLKRRGGAQGSGCLCSKWCPGKCNHHGSSFRIITVDSINLMIYWCPILRYLYSSSFHVVLIKSMHTFLRSLKMKVRSFLSVRWFIFSTELLISDLVRSSLICPLCCLIVSFFFSQVRTFNLVGLSHSRWLGGSVWKKTWVGQIRTVWIAWYSRLLFVYNVSWVTGNNF